MTNVPQYDPEEFEAFKRGGMDPDEEYSFIYRHFLTEDERVQLAKDAVTLADISCGRVKGGQGKYRKLASDINARIGFEYYHLDCF